MKIRWTAPLQRLPKHILEEAGYHAFTDPQSGQESFVMRLRRDYYPRFHLYLSEKGGGYIFDLHIDQKKSTAGRSAHAGEYEGPVVDEEGARLNRWLTHYSAPQ